MAKSFHQEERPPAGLVSVAGGGGGCVASWLGNRHIAGPLDSPRHSLLGDQRAAGGSARQGLEGASRGRACHVPVRLSCGSLVFLFLFHGLSRLELAARAAPPPPRGSRLLLSVHGPAASQEGDRCPRDSSGWGAAQTSAGSGRKTCRPRGHGFSRVDVHTLPVLQTRK